MGWIVGPDTIGGMEQAPQEAEAASSGPPPAPPAEVEGAPAAAAADPGPAIMDPEQAARRLRRFITCLPGQPTGCRGFGWLWVQQGGFRHKAVCPCIQKEHEKQAARAQVEADAQGRRAAELVAAADGLPDVEEPRHIPAGARERLAVLRREVGKEEARLAAMREKVSEALAAVANDLIELDADERSNAQGLVEAEATRRMAAAQLEEARARLEGLRAEIEEATATHERLTAESGQFGARRMELAAREKETRDRLAPTERESAKRLKDLKYRTDQHLARWPELAEAPPS